MKLTRFSRGLGIAASYFAYYALLGLLQPYLAPLLSDWGFSHTAISGVMAASALCTTVAPMWLLQATGGRVRGNRLIGGTAVLALGGALLLGAMAQLEHARYLWVAALLLYSGLYSPISAMLDTVAVAATSKGPWTFGLLRMMGSLGFIAASSTMGLFAEGDLTEPLHGGLVIIAGGLMAACLMLPKETTACLDTKPAPRAKAKDAPYPKGFVPLLFALSLHWFTFGPYMYGYTLLARQSGVPSKWVGLAWSLAVVGELACFAVADKVVEKIGFRMTLTIAFAAASLRWTLYGLFPIPAVLVAAQVLHGPSFALFYVGTMTAIRLMGTDTERLRMQGAFTGLVTGFSATLGIGFAGVAATYLPLQAAFLWVLPAQGVAISLLWLTRSLTRQARAISAQAATQTSA